MGQSRHEHTALELKRIFKRKQEQKSGNASILVTISAAASILSSSYSLPFWPPKYEQHHDL